MYMKYTTFGTYENKNVIEHFVDNYNDDDNSDDNYNNFVILQLRKNLIIQQVSIMDELSKLKLINEKLNKNYILLNNTNLTIDSKQEYDDKIKMLLLNIKNLKLDQKNLLSQRLDLTKT